MSQTALGGTVVPSAGVNALTSLRRTGYLKAIYPHTVADVVHGPLQAFTSHLSGSKGSLAGAGTVFRVIMRTQPQMMGWS